MPTKRTTLRLSDVRQQLLDEASEIVAGSPDGDPPMADVIDAALTHLVESEQNVQDARDERRNLMPDGDLYPERERQDPTDVPGHDRAAGVDDPVPDAEYGDDRAEPTLGYPEWSGEERIELPIPDGAEYDLDDLGDGRIVVQWWKVEEDDRDD